MTEKVAAIGRADDVLFVEKPSGWTWLFILVCALLMFGLFVACMPPKTAKDIAAGLFGLLAGSFLAWAAYSAFGERNHSSRFFGDRVEVHGGDDLLHRLPYAAVESVAYGFRAGDSADQFLRFSGPGGKPRIYLTISGKEGTAGPEALDETKLVSLRDLLNDVVSSRMVAEARRPEGADWFGGLRLADRGVLAADRLVPWPRVRISADESTGGVNVFDGITQLGSTSMVNANIVPGLMAARQLQGEAAASGA